MFPQTIQILFFFYTFVPIYSVRIGVLTVCTPFLLKNTVGKSEHNRHKLLLNRWETIKSIWFKWHCSYLWPRHDPGLRPWGQDWAAGAGDTHPFCPTWRIHNKRDEGFSENSIKSHWKTTKKIKTKRFRVYVLHHQVHIYIYYFNPNPTSSTFEGNTLISGFEMDMKYFYNVSLCVLEGVYCTWRSEVGINHSFAQRVSGEERGHSLALRKQKPALNNVLLQHQYQEEHRELEGESCWHYHHFTKCGYWNESVQV